jgi:hypothetical protein
MAENGILNHSLSKLIGEKTVSIRFFPYAGVGGYF